MNKRQSDLFLADIMQNINLLEEFTMAGEKEFFSSIKTQYAVLKCIENIGEAVKNLDVEIKNAAPCIDWKAIAGIRNVLAHQYFSVSIKLIWKIVEKDIPPLKICIAEIQEKQKKQSDNEQSKSSEQDKGKLQEQHRG
ncbi:MAG: hypothetical protein BWY31_03879 [Lentisphaerae bacterium ADurb.Bin242]|nr:MAG: hypothetical protein BWY31_03879 [Lentisphaerae bacterium ADurb.Bin242]